LIILYKSPIFSNKNDFFDFSGGHLLFERRDTQIRGSSRYDNLGIRNLSTVTMANEKKALEIRVVKQDAPERSGFPGQADIA